MTQEECAGTGCNHFINNVRLLELHRKDTNTPNAFPLDVEWKNCANGPDCWANCTKRKEQAKINRMNFNEYVKYLIDNKRAETAWQTVSQEETDAIPSGPIEPKLLKSLANESTK